MLCPCVSAGLWRWWKALWTWHVVPWDHGPMMRQVVIAGGTGEVGKRLLALMAARTELSVRALVRRPGSTLAAPNIEEVPFDYEDAAAYVTVFRPPCDLLLIALGTTRAKARSEEH